MGYLMTLKNNFYNNNYESFKTESTYLSETHAKIFMDVINAEICFKIKQLIYELIIVENE